MQLSVAGDCKQKSSCATISGFDKLRISTEDAYRKGVDVETQNAMMAARFRYFYFPHSCSERDCKRRPPCHAAATVPAIMELGGASSSRASKKNRLAKGSSCLRIKFVWGRGFVIAASGYRLCETT